jgi:hypothetical protein
MEDDLRAWNAVKFGDRIFQGFSRTLGWRVIAMEFGEIRHLA